MLILRTERNNIIEATYNSSNIIASTYNKDESSLTLIFKKGIRYLYTGVRGSDYMRFETADSQGVALTTYLKKYTTTKLSDINVDVLLNEIAGNLRQEQKETEKLMVETMDNIVKSYYINNEIDGNLLSVLKVYLNNLK
jgi:hypothetical protein